MKTVLITTDFSNASRNASLYGLQLAKALNANIILFNAYQVPASVAALEVSISRYDIMKQTEQKLVDELDKIGYINMPELKTICDEGVAEEAIINIANEKKVDFIITGMKGSSKNIKKIFGSTVTKLVRKSNIPVIIIPEDAKFSIPKIILYASDISLDTNIQPIDQIKSITEHFKSKLYVVRVVKDEYGEIFERINTPQKLREELQILDTTFQYPINADITHTLNEFVLQHHVDMLVMMPHKHEWMDRLFRKSETKDMIFHAHVPVLVLPEMPAERRV
jgi:nucleotide-binding universal stress UspA family protein